MRCLVKDSVGSSPHSVGTSGIKIVCSEISRGASRKYSLRSAIQIEGACPKAFKKWASAASELSVDVRVDRNRYPLHVEPAYILTNRPEKLPLAMASVCIFIPSR